MLAWKFINSLSIANMQINKVQDQERLQYLLAFSISFLILSSYKTLYLEINIKLLTVPEY